MNVREIPFWTDSGYEMPVGFELRKNDDLVTIVYAENDDLWHVDIPSGEFDEEALTPMLSNLRGAVLYHKHPDLVKTYFEDHAECVMGMMPVEKFLARYSSAKDDLLFGGVKWLPDSMTGSA